MCSTLKQIFAKTLAGIQGVFKKKSKQGLSDLIKKNLCLIGFLRRISMVTLVRHGIFMLISLWTQHGLKKGCALRYLVTQILSNILIVGTHALLKSLKLVILKDILSNFLVFKGKKYFLPHCPLIQLVSLYNSWI